MCDSSTFSSGAPCRSHPSQTYGWVDGDAYHSFSGSMRSTAWSSATRALTLSGPALTSGAIYEVRYVQPFHFTRKAATLCVGPDHKLDYCWSDTCSQAQLQNAQVNYMYVVGYINGTERSKQLLLFYNAGGLGCCPDDPAAAVPSTWIPAIYDRKSGTLFSEVGTAQVQGNARDLCWSIFTRSADPQGGGDGPTVGHHEARAGLLCDCNRMQAAIQWLNYILQALVQNDAHFSAFVDLSAVVYAMAGIANPVLDTKPSCCTRGIGTTQSVVAHFPPEEEPASPTDQWWDPDSGCSCDPAV